MYLLNKINDLLYICLSALLAFGPHNPLTTYEAGMPEDNIVTNVLCLIILCISIVNGHLFLAISKFAKIFIPLILVLITLFISSIIYSEINSVGDPYFNTKFLGSIILFIVFIQTFTSNPQLCYNCIIIYSVTLSLIAICCVLGIIPNIVDYSNGRLIIFGENPNSYSSRIFLAVFSIFYIVTENKKRLNSFRYILMLFIPSLLMLTLLSGSRGSVLILLVGLVIMLLFSPLQKFNKIFLMIIIVLCVILGIIYVLNDEFLYERLIQSVSEGKTSGRGEIWLNALSVFADYPIIGVGENGYHIEMINRFNESRDAHNIFIYLLCSGGVIGCILFLYCIILVLINCYRNTNNSIYPLIIILSLILLMSKTGGVMTYIVMWYFMAIAYSQTLIKN